jgi:hypothetical protein
MINKTEAIRVAIPNINANPPITSKSPTGKASSGGSPREPKKPGVLSIPSSFGRPCIMKAIPAIILIGKGANEAIVVIFNKRVLHSTIFNCFIFIKFAA